MAPGPSDRPPARLAWLDVLRGVAALAVAAHHAAYYYLPSAQRALSGRFDFGRWGVLVFFLVSGYIIPASLERRGSVRGFWTGRFFRIYPLLALASVLALVPFLAGRTGLRGDLDSYHPVTAVLAHLTMLQDLVAVPNVMNVLWTLSYEMAFYLIVVALFVTGTHRRSMTVSLALAGTSLVSAVALPIVLFPPMLLSRTAGTGPIVIATVLLLAGAIAAAVSARPAARVAGGLLGGLLAAVLVLMNSRVAAWEGLAILAVMFAGTVAYRAEHRQVSRRRALLAGGGVLAAVTAAGLAAGDYWGGDRVIWSTAVLGAAATFAAAWLLRRRRFPRALTGLGAISFSVYLLHPLLIVLAVHFGGLERADDPLGLLVFTAVLLLVSWAVYRWLEAPAQRYGRRLARRGGTVSGPERSAVPVRDPVS
ncbi:acyltransferase family protein [Spirillospora albida]|uniref:acyltransferase family protein n=1 Tax=Spirillospora albida TaxID=58123 RepID=UPI0009FBC87E|nr:acyltransferase [Spirillospora albida]